MSAKSYQWIDTNRLTDAEILSEIAACDATIAVLGRGEQPVPQIDALLANLNLASDSIDIVWASVPGKQLSAEYFPGWPTPLVLLVQDPGQSSLLIVVTEKSRQRNSLVGLPSSLWDWSIRHQAAGGRVFPVTLESKPLACPSLRERVPRRLVPAASRSLDPVFRRNIQQFAGLKLTESVDVTALRAGLFQWHDALDESHECSQSIEGKGRHQAGDYWHAIMHRREPDYGNSKYWFRRVGPHPIFPELARRAEPVISKSLPDWKDRLLRGGWDPCAFVDLCECAADGKHPAEETAAETIQEIEMLLLLGSTYQDAVSW